MIRFLVPIKRWLLSSQKLPNNLRFRIQRRWKARRNHTELCRRHDELVRELIAMILNGHGGTAGSGRVLAEAEAMAKALSLSAASGRKNLGTAVVVILVVLSAAAVAGTLRIRKVNVVADVFTRHVKMKLVRPFELPEPWEAERIDASGLSFLNVVTPSFSDVSPWRSDINDLDFALEAEGPATAFSVEALSTENAGAELTLTKDKRGFTCELANQPVHLRAAFSGATRIAAGHDGPDIAERHASSETADWVEGMHEGNSKIPVSLRLRAEKGVMLPNIGATDIQFLRPRPSGAGPDQFESSIEKGEVEIVETGAKHRIQNGDYLVLNGLRARRVAVASNTDDLRVTIEGEADEVYAGPQGFRTNLKPRWIEYMAHSEWVKTYWPAAVGIIGLLLTAFRYLLWRSA